MADGRAAVGFDRLPWLEDEPPARARPRERRRAPAAWPLLAVAGTALVAGVSYWLGMKSWEPETAIEAPAPSTTITIPEAKPPAADVAREPEVRPSPVPEVRPAPMPTVRIDRPRARSAAPTRRKKLSPMEMDKSELAETVAKQSSVAKEEPARAVKPAPAPTVRTVPARQQPLRLWPARERRGAYGRVVQIGAFGSRHQAKLGWRYMARAYPGVRRLPAVVVEARNSRGRRFYRFQIGTTSQAHSEVLCQRMQRIRFSCAVVGLPWKSKVER